MASPRSPPGKFRFSKNTLFSNCKLWEIVIMSFLTHRNHPETLGGHIKKNDNFELFDFFLHGQIFIVFTILGLLWRLLKYQNLSLINISSRFNKPVNNYVESIIQILKHIFLRLCCEKRLMIKWCFLMYVLSAEYCVRFSQFYRFYRLYRPVSYTHLTLPTKA